MSTDPNDEHSPPDSGGEFGERDIATLKEFAQRKGIAPAANVVRIENGAFVQISNGEPEKPPLEIDRPFNYVAQALGLEAKKSNLFRRGEQFVTVDSETGETRGMTSARFVSWIEGIVSPVRSVERKKAPGEYWLRYARLGKEAAQSLLESDHFRASVRELRGVHEVRLPVWRVEGKKRTIELLPEGYDEATGIFTADTVPFDFELDPVSARKWLDELLEGYPFADEASRAVQFAAMLSPFARLLLPEGAKRLMIIHNGNQPGTGKSTLARMALAGVYGAAAVKSVDRDPAELRKVLDTCAFERKPFLFLDNMTDLRSPELNAFVTSGRWSARVLGKSQTEEVTVEAQVFLNGNQLDVGRELARRAAVCNLFLATDPLERKFAREISDEWLVEPATRGSLLAVAWAAVRQWRDAGMQIDPQHTRASFEAYTKLVGSIVAAFGMGAPFAPTAISGDEEGEATAELLDAAAASVQLVGNPGKNFNSDELLALADELHLIEAIVPYCKNELGKKQVFGRKVKAWRGRERTDKRGRRYEFGKSRDGQTAIYTITIFPPDQAD